MTYLLLKSIHIASVITWMGGMVLMAAVLLWLKDAQCPRTERETAVIRAVRRWDGRVTSPAMGLAWLFGVLVAYQGDWFSAPWLHAKLVFVIALSALHGMLSASLRRLADDPMRTPPAYQRFAGLIVIAAIVVIVLLVVVKPF